MLALDDLGAVAGRVLPQGGGVAAGELALVARVLLLPPRAAARGRRGHLVGLAVLGRRAVGREHLGALGALLRLEVGPPLVELQQPRVGRLVATARQR